MGNFVVTTVIGEGSEQESDRVTDAEPAVSMTCWGVDGVVVAMARPRCFFPPRLEAPSLVLNSLVSEATRDSVGCGE